MIRECWRVGFWRYLTNPRGLLMGMDFSALMRYDGLRQCRGAITSFVREAPAEFSAVVDLWRARDFFDFSDKYTFNAWVDPETNRQVKRPNEANVNVALRMPEGFFITFGRDAIRVYHLLRWMTIPPS